MYYEIRNESAFNTYLKLWQQRTLQVYDYSNWLAAWRCIISPCSQQTMSYHFSLCFLIRMPKFQWASKFLSKQEVWALDNSYKILLCLSKWALVLRIKINMEKKKTIFTIFSIMKFFEHNIAYCKLMN